MPLRPAYQLYEDVMTRLVHGTPLWHPTPSSPDGIAIGDVGFVEKGQFCRLFRATLSVEELESDVPDGFTPLVLATSGLKCVTRKPYPLHTHSVRVSGGEVGASMNTPTIVPGRPIRFQLSRDEGAVFLTTGDTSCSDTIQKGLLKNYIKRHYSAWVDYAHDHGYGDVDLILVSGIDTTQDFAMVACAKAENRFSATLTADIPPIASTWANVWTDWSHTGPLHLNWVDVEQSEESVTYVPFFRGWRMKKRPFWFPTVVKAGAEPRDPDVHDPDQDMDDGIISDSPEKFDSFDRVFKYIFENCTADVALLHDDDLTSIFKMSNAEDSIEVILEKFRPGVSVESGVATLATRGDQGVHNPFDQETEVEYRPVADPTEDFAALPAEVPSTSTSIVQQTIGPPTSLAFKGDITDNWGYIVPQRRYQPPKALEEHLDQERVDFTVQGKSGISVRDALEGKYGDLDHRDDHMFLNSDFSICLRLKWPGYEPWSRQIRTASWHRNPRPITRAILSGEIAKALDKFIQDAQRMHDNQEWRVGPGFIDLDHLALVALERVSKGSWQPSFRVIWYAPRPAALISLIGTPSSMCSSPSAPSLCFSEDDLRSFSPTEPICPSEDDVQEFELVASTKSAKVDPNYLMSATFEKLKDTGRRQGESTVDDGDPQELLPVFDNLLITGEVQSRIFTTNASGSVVGGPVPNRPSSPQYPHSRHLFDIMGLSNRWDGPTAAVAHPSTPYTWGGRFSDDRTITVGRGMRGNFSTQSEAIQRHTLYPLGNPGHPYLELTRHAQSRRIHGVEDSSVPVLDPRPKESKQRAFFPSPPPSKVPSASGQIAPPRLPNVRGLPPLTIGDFSPSTMTSSAFRDPDDSKEDSPGFQMGGHSLRTSHHSAAISRTYDFESSSSGAQTVTPSAQWTVTSSPGGHNSGMMLNNLLQARGILKNFVGKVKMDGPNHYPTWYAEFYIDGVLYGKGTGPTKSGAKEVAAQATLARLECL